MRLAPSVVLLLALLAPASLAGQAPAAQPEEAPARRELIGYLTGIARAQLDRRWAEVARIDTRAAAERRATTNRATVLELIGGLPERAGALNAKSYGTVRGDGFTVEKITYESLPGFVVTANLYLPTAGSGPFPAVLLTAGHDVTGKLGQYSWGVNLARAGIASLAYDPMAEGERLQYWDSAKAQSPVGRPTGEHSHSGLQTLLIGDHVARYFVQDAMRGIDYLVARPEIDDERIGAFGCSGGGTVTAYLAALDDRVKAAATACYITSFTELLTQDSPQEGEQSIPHFLERGLDLVDWVEMAAPKPYAIVSTTEDMFPFAGARRAADEARRIYGLYGAGDRLVWLTGPGGHGALGPVSADLVAFFARWLGTGGTAPGYTPVRNPSPAELQITPTGQLLSSTGSETVYTLNRARAAALLPRPRPLASAAELERLRARVGENVRAAAGMTARPGAPPPPVRVLGRESREGYQLETVALQPEPGIELAALLAVPGHTGPRPTLLLLDPRPKEELAAPGGEVDRLARAGWMVLVLQPRGTPGGTEAMKSPLLGTYYILSLRALLVGKTLVGMRADDAIRAVDWLASRPDVDRSAISGYGVGSLGPALLHAAALDQRFAQLFVESSLASYRMAVDEPLHQDLPEVAVPGVLRGYDLGDLILASSARRVTVVDPVDALRQPLGADAFRARLDYLFASERALGRPDRLRVLTRTPGAPMPLE